MGNGMAERSSEGETLETEQRNRKMNKVIDTNY